jgi:hypothetical protein
MLGTWAGVITLVVLLTLEELEEGPVMAEEPDTAELLELLELEELEEPGATGSGRIGRFGTAGVAGCPGPLGLAGVAWASSTGEVARAAAVRRWNMGRMGGSTGAGCLGVVCPRLDGSIVEQHGAQHPQNDQEEKGARASQSKGGDQVEQAVGHQARQSDYCGELEEGNHGGGCGWAVGGL